tara:strand:- start:235 stop:396 length:162 start_codon:yes stop_codon:yes gene_type:complete
VCDKATADEKVRDRVGTQCTPEGLMVKLALEMNWEKNEKLDLRLKVGPQLTFP